MLIKSFFANMMPLLSFLFWLPILCYCEGPLRALAVVLAVVLHECGHLFAFWLLGEKRPRLSFHALGFTLTPRRMLSYRHEAAVSLCGPLVNLLTALCSLPFSSLSFFSALSAISFLLAFVHLLPIIPLDGGRICFALSHARFGESGVRFAAALSRITLCIALFFFLYFLLYYGIGLAPLFSVLMLFHEQQPYRYDL